MALITCKNCGKMISDKAKACPHCGTLVDFEQTVNGETSLNHNQETEPNRVVTSEPVEYYEGPERKSHAGLIITAVLGLLALLGVGCWLWYDNNQKLAEQERQMAILAEKARQDSIATVELREQARQDSIAKQTLQEQLEKTKSISSLYMDYWGTIGELSLNCFVMKGQEGYYQFSGADNVKRTLKVASYDKSSGRCKLDAYLRGKYIGAFEGIFDEDQASYQGVFISVRGIKLDFDIGIYGD